MKTKLQITKVVIVRQVDDDPDTSYLEQKGIGFEARLEAYRRGDFGFVGITAKAELLNPRSQVCHVVRSGGLWGIESDSGADYLESVGKDELDNLRAELTALGIGERAIDRAFQKVETVEK